MKFAARVLYFLSAIVRGHLAGWLASYQVHPLMVVGIKDLTTHQSIRMFLTMERKPTTIPRTGLLLYTSWIKPASQLPSECEWTI